MSNRDRAQRGIWLAIIVLASLVAALIVGLVTRAGGSEVPTALGAGGATFLAAATLGLAARRYLDE